MEVMREQNSATMATTSLKISMTRDNITIGYITKALVFLVILMLTLLPIQHMYNMYIVIT